MGLYCNSCFEEYIFNCVRCHNFYICLGHYSQNNNKKKNPLFDICYNCDEMICEECIKKYCCTQIFTENSDDKEFEANLCIKCIDDTL